MEAFELRIGNWVYIPQTKTNEQIGVIEENGRFLTKGYKTSYSSIECSRPIPLTEEWLLRFGFSIKKQKSIHGTDIFYISHCDIDYCFAYAEFRGDYGFYIEYTDSPYEKDKNYQYSVSFGIKHVHTLQNLYFALTGEELKLKDNESKID